MVPPAQTTTLAEWVLESTHTGDEPELRGPKRPQGWRAETARKLAEAICAAADPVMR